ncbi:hypothetical protein PPERSA_06046 [Pseudocohnilembus persalinus]|uniref:Uncharacterized protein n=1 Tax=Pseudocohnilembus persalinus TaxID=266149 RepID=A0A0V0QQP5_PSEPJ|nr:hypothetical protein PPERSA_06046 [Pseudocohnilembus persalinus]|eukprot:KRX04493.1 hypothetical protein PPERSA_06046 [Pseudocohnilembus persalinus]
MDITNQIWEFKNKDIINIIKTIKFSLQEESQVQVKQNVEKLLENKEIDNQLEKNLLQTIFKIVVLQEKQEESVFADFEKQNLGKIQKLLLQALNFELQNDFIAAYNQYFDLVREKNLNEVQKILVQMKLAIYNPIKKQMKENFNQLKKNDLKIIKENNYQIIESFFFKGQQLFLAQFLEIEELKQEILKIQNIYIKEHEFQYYLGYVLMEIDNFKQGEKILKKLDSEIKDKNMVIHCQIHKIIGNGYFNQENYKQALKYYDSVYDQFKRDMDLVVNIGCCYQNLEEFEKGEKYFNIAIKLNPNYEETYLLLGELYEQSEDFDQAEEIYKTCISKFSNSSEPLISLAELYIDDMKEEDAKKLLKQAEKLDPLNKKIYVNLGKLHENLQEFDKSIENYHKAIQIDPKYPDSYYECGSVYEQQANFEKAKDYYELAVKYDDKFFEAWQAIGQMYESKQFKNIDKAIHAYKKCAEINEDDIDQLFAVADLLIQEERTGEALQYLVKCFRQDPSFKEAIEEADLVKVVEKLIKIQESVEENQYKKILQIQAFQNKYEETFSEKVLNDIFQNYFNLPVISTFSNINEIFCQDEFSQLNEKEKNYTYGLFKAAWEGAKICYFQKSYESPALFIILQLVFSAENQPLSQFKKRFLEKKIGNENQWNQIMAYCAGFFNNCGNYKSFGSTKFVPEVSEEIFTKFIQLSNNYQVHQKLIDFLWEDIKELVFQYKGILEKIDFPSKGQIGYYSQNITKEEIQKVDEFLKIMNLDPTTTRILKQSDSHFQIHFASINLKSYKHKYENKIEFNIGFTQSQMDPKNTRNEFQGIVALANKQKNEITQKFIDKIQTFLDLLPWPRQFENQEFKKPYFTQLSSISYASSMILPGLNLPSLLEIRQSEGLKNALLENCLSKIKNGIQFFNKQDQQHLINWQKQVSFHLIMFNQILGAGSGKLFYQNEQNQLNFDQNQLKNPLNNQKITKFYQKNENFYSVFKELAFPYEQCRQDTISLYMSCFPQATDLLQPEFNEKWEEICYCVFLSFIRMAIHGLQMYNINKKQFIQPRQQGRWVIFQVLLEIQNDFVDVEKKVKANGEEEIQINEKREVLD